MVESLEFLPIPGEDAFHDVKIQVQKDELVLTQFEVLKKENFPGYQDQKLNIKYLISLDGGLTIDTHPKGGEEIAYPYEYYKMIHSDFEKVMGADALVFRNKDIIDRQRSVVGYLIKSMGTNLLSGKSIMNVSLPINIFDVRSLLEV